MASLHRRMGNVLRTAHLAALAAMTLSPLTGMAALERMDDDAMSGVSGAGIALGFEDFRWLTKPTSYYEQMGSNPVGDTTFQRADMRWYGLSITAIADGTGANQGFHWDQSGTSFGTACSGTGLACPLGGQIVNFAPFDNPYVLRAYSPFGYHYDGTPLNEDPNVPDKTVYEYVAPTVQPYYNFSFMGEIEAGRTGPNENLQSGTGEFLKSQTLIQGNAAGSIFRMFQHTQPGNETFAIMYHSHLRGDFRFSAGQDSRSASDVVGVPVIFDEDEGLHFKNVDAFIALGQPFYQALTLDAVPQQDGNFILEIPFLRDPALPTTGALNNAIKHFYSFAVPETVSDPSDPFGQTLPGFITARLAILENTPGANVDAYKAHVSSTYNIPIADIELPESYEVTHGYSRWGDWTPCRGIGCPSVHGIGAATPVSHPNRNSYNSTSDGMFFRKCKNCRDFDAFAYLLTAVDVRNGNSQFSCPGGEGCTAQGYTPRGVTSNRNNGLGALYDGSHNANGRYYARSDSCTATAGDPYRCGYGGSYSVNAGGAHVYVNGKQDPSEIFGVASRPYTENREYSCGPFGVFTCDEAVPKGIPVIRTDVVNIGDSRIEGLQMNYMKFTSYGAGAP
ncbi:hypothetical protein Y5S_02640 [Alcanivorax nanhaiticus]|uniref:Uncharacterized protein n=1 Tax=Alcanivorax nanhaiticus TaxID=1177154 RepID=A0A095UNP9_9GAMM|nr:hypothetical protein [Alcanivorax nanhaiticus]KGD64100.1 hypothetical protein Y5S_02640 [Alcanivorax nanhaiticus]